MQALLAITTLDIDRERRVMVVRPLERLHCAKRCVFVDQQIVIAETFAGKHFCQSRLSCINLSSLCQVRNVGFIITTLLYRYAYPFSSMTTEYTSGKSPRLFL
jgi:hypothetical protein